MYGSHKSHYPWLKCHENEEKIDNYYVWEITIESKLLNQFVNNLQDLVSFFSEDNILSNEIKISYIFLISK